VCAEIGHTKPDCSVVDLYEIEDPKAFMLQNAGEVQPTQPIQQPKKDAKGFLDGAFISGKFPQDFGAPMANFNDFDNDEDDESLNSI